MKKYRIIAFLILIIIFICVAFFIWKNLNKDNNQNQKEKALSEIKYVELKLTNLINTMNKIEDKNYRISIAKIPAELENAESASGSTSGEDSKSGSEEKIGGSDNKGRRFSTRRTSF